MTLTLKQNDTSPSASYTLTAGSDNVNLTGASVRFFMANHNGIKVNAAATIVNPLLGTVRYDWIAADTDLTGTFKAEFEVTYADGSVETFPNSDFLLIDISPDITDAP